MRVLVVTATLLVACGGSAPPEPQTPSSPDTSSLESIGGSSAKEAPSDSASPATSSAAAAPPAAAPAPSEAPAADAAPAPAFHPAPSATGAIDGKPFAPKVAQILGAMKKDGRIPITLTEASECPAAGEKGDHASLTMLVPWQDGYKVDLSALKISGKKGPGEIGFSRSKVASATFKPSGTVTVVTAPMEKGGKGKLKIDLQSGDYMLAGNLDIEVCVSPK